MAVRAKFRVTGKSETGVSLMAVYDPDPSSENGRFFSATPFGQIQMGIMNKAALEAFEVGKEYYVDFTPAG